MPVISDFDLDFYHNKTNYSDKDEITIDLLCLTISFFFLYIFINFSSLCYNNCCLSRKKNYLSRLEIQEEEEQINLECPICLEIIDDNKNLSVIKCKHAYHSDCLEKWIQTSLVNNSFKCPLCNVKYHC